MAKSFRNMTNEEVYQLLCDDESRVVEVFDELYERLSKNVYTYCLKVLGDSPFVDDIFQETFARFFDKSLNKKELTSVSGYIIKIARNLCLEEKNRRQLAPNYLSDFAPPFYDSTNERKENAEIINLALEALSEKYREVIILKEFLDMSYKEIADALNLTMSVVKIRIHRAKTKLREILAPHFEEYADNKLDIQ